MTATDKTRRQIWNAQSHNEVVEIARAWLAIPALAELLAALGGPPPKDLKALMSWSSSTLDTRAGRERRAAPAASWSETWLDKLILAAGPLGLLDSAGPQLDAYDSVVILGGTTTGNQRRVALAASALDSVERELVVALGAERTLSESEHASDPDSKHETSEWENLRRQLNVHFGPLVTVTLDTGGTDTGHWRDEQLQAPEHMNVRLLAAPSPEPSRRANTSDSIAFFLQRVPTAQRGTVLLITSAIYAPYQFIAVAPTILQHGARQVELIGTPTAQSPDRQRQAQQIAQEIHAALGAAYRVLI